MLSRSQRKQAIVAVAIFIFLYIIYSFKPPEEKKVEHLSRKTSMISSDGSLFEYDRQSPLIFIGGVPRSGERFWTVFD